MRRNVHLAAYAVLIACSALVSCSDDVGVGRPSSEPVVTKITVSPHTASLGEELTVSITMINNSDDLMVLHYSSSPWYDFSILHGDNEIARFTDHYPVSGELRLPPGMTYTSRYKFFFGENVEGGGVTWLVDGDELEVGRYMVIGGMQGYEAEYPWATTRLFLTPILHW